MNVLKPAFVGLFIIGKTKLKKRAVHAHAPEKVPKINLFYDGVTIFVQRIVLVLEFFFEIIFDCLDFHWASVVLSYSFNLFSCPYNFFVVFGYFSNEINNSPPLSEVYVTEGKKKQAYRDKECLLDGENITKLETPRHRDEHCGDLEVDFMCIRRLVTQKKAPVAPRMVGIAVSSLLVTL